MCAACSQQIADCCRRCAGSSTAAGVLDDGVLLQQDWARFARVMAPKVEGAWNSAPR